MDSSISKLVTQLTKTIQSELDNGGNLTIEDTVRLVSMYAIVGQMEAMQLAAMHLGNIHQTLITPGANGEPVGVADLLRRVGGTLERFVSTHGVTDEVYEAANRAIASEQRIRELEDSIPKIQEMAYEHGYIAGQGLKG